MSSTRANTNRSAPVTILQCRCRMPYSLMTVRAVDCRQFLISCSPSSRGLADPVTAVLVSKIHEGSFPRDLFWSNSFGGGAKKKKRCLEGGHSPHNRTAMSHECNGVFAFRRRGLTGQCTDSPKTKKKKYSFLIFVETLLLLLSSLFCACLVFWQNKCGREGKEV